MSTPRTDAVAKRYDTNEIGAAEVLIHAGELERENAALRDSQCTTWHLEKLLAEKAALLDLIEDMAHQHCQTVAAHNYYNGQVPGTMVTDSGAFSVNAESLRLLAQTNPPRFRIVAEHGRMVVGYWPENDPQKEAQP